MHVATLRSSVLAMYDGHDRWLVADTLLTAGRALVAILCLVDLWLRHPASGDALVLVAGLTLYGAWCTVIAATLIIRPASAHALRPAVQLLDACVIGLLVLVDDPFGLHLILLLSFAFVLARYGGGVRQALTTTLVVGVMFAARAVWHPFAYPLVAIAAGAGRVVTLAGAGVLFTWCDQRRRVATTRASAAERLIGWLRPELGTSEVFRAVLEELLQLADARSAVVALEHMTTRRLVLVTLGPSRGKHADLQMHRFPRALRGLYFFESPSGTAAARCGRPSAGFPLNRDADVQVIATGSDWRATVPPGFQHAHPYGRVYAFAFQSLEGWNGRLFLLDPSNRQHARSTVRSIETLLRELVPAVSSTCDLQALRRRAAARERARIGRELHDGIVQQLAALKIELELLRRGCQQDGSLAAGLARVQERLQTELANLRGLMQHSRSHDVDGSQLPEILADLVERFGRETGIAANFFSDVAHVRLPAEVCGEIARIVQEALVNVRRHSGARHVVVRFGLESDEWRLSIQDDGRGFQTWVPAPGGAHEGIVRPPAVIRERVHALGGRLHVASAVGCGARLDIALP